MRPDEMLDYALRQMRAGNATRTEEQVILRCPKCYEEGSNHFVYVEHVKGLFHCFHCSFGGSMRRALVRRRGDWKAALRFVEERAGSTLPGAEDLSDELTPILTVGGKLRVGGMHGGLVRKAYDYCLERGMTREQVQDYRVSIWPFESRVFFPVWDEAGETTFWVGRTLLDREDVTKTVEPGGSDKPLYGRHVNPIKGEMAVLVEGVFDHFATPGSYAMLGSVVTDGQCRTLRADGVRCVFVVGDPDIGEKMGVSVRRLARRGLVPFPVKLEGTLGQPDCDPADVGVEEMRRLTAALPSFMGRRSQTLVFKPFACLPGV